MSALWPGPARCAHAGAVAALAAAARVGCMNLIPAYERPAAPVAATYPAESTPATAPGAAAAADIEWQRFFADPRLKRLIELALQNNRDLRIAVLNIEQARALYQCGAPTSCPRSASVRPRRASPARQRQAREQLCGRHRADAATSSTSSAACAA